MIEQAVYYAMTNTAAISSQVGSRVYLQQRLAGTSLPAIVFEVRSIAAVRMLSGASGLFSAEVGITSVADTYLGARTVADAVRGAFDATTHTTATAILESVRFDGETPQESLLADGEENEPTRIEQVFQVHYRSAS